ncbi:MAG: hypothetical protein RL368_2109 [Pseudomonadota bacterium]
MSQIFKVFIGILLVIGASVRLLPLLSEQRMFHSISEDGYLMMTIARNFALGFGMSTADGTLPTNGTQPLMTFVWAIFYWLTDGDKSTSVIFIVLTQFVISVLAAYLLWKLSIKLLENHPQRFEIAALTSGVWFASPVFIGMSMNGLETGAYALIVLAICYGFLLHLETLRWRQVIFLGLALGICFWTRNDAIFFIFAVCVSYVLVAGERAQQIQRFYQILVMGSVSVLVAVPWLVNNYKGFGSIMPISGQAEALTAHFGYNLPFLPPVLVENFMVFLPIPSSIQNTPPVLALSLIFLLGTFWGLQKFYSRLETRAQRWLFTLVSIYGLGFCGFYGLYFGAEYFIPRYFYPLSPFTSLLWAVLVLWIWARIKWWVLKGLLVSLMLGVIVSLHARDFGKSASHPHFQVVNWVDRHVPTSDWVGAIQSGTLGYFHDRTINLDGKVNPEALAARRREQVGYYVVSKSINYLADWTGKWMYDPVLSKYFLIVVNDKERNLGVLRRRQK